MKCYSIANIYVYVVYISTVLALDEIEMNLEEEINIDSLLNDIICDPNLEKTYIHWFDLEKFTHNPETTNILPCNQHIDGFDNENGNTSSFLTDISNSIPCEIQRIEKNSSTQEDKIKDLVNYLKDENAHIPHDFSNIEHIKERDNEIFDEIKEVFEQHINQSCFDRVQISQKADVSNVATKSYDNLDNDLHWLDEYIKSTDFENINDFIVEDIYKKLNETLPVCNINQIEDELISKIDLEVKSENNNINMCFDYNFENSQITKDFGSHHKDSINSCTIDRTNNQSENLQTFNNSLVELLDIDSKQTINDTISNTEDHSANNYIMEVVDSKQTVNDTISTTEDLTSNNYIMEILDSDGKQIDCTTEDLIDNNYTVEALDSNQIDSSTISTTENFTANNNETINILNILRNNRSDGNSGHILRNTYDDNQLKRKLKTTTADNYIKRMRALSQYTDNNLPTNNNIQTLTVECNFNKPKIAIVKSIMGYQNDPYEKILKIIRELLSNKSTETNEGSALDIDLDSMIRKILYYCSKNDISSFKEQIFKNNTELDKFIEEYVKLDMFVPFEVLNIKISDRKKLEEYSPLNKLKNLNKLINIEEMKIFKTQKFNISTPINSLNNTKINENSYIVLFGSSFNLHSFIFWDRYKKSTFCFFIAEKLLLLRSLYSDVPELICIDMLISSKLNKETLIKIYLYLNIIEIVKNNKDKVLAIVDEILKLLNMKYRLREQIEDNIEPEIYTDLMFIAFNFIPNRARKDIIKEINKIQGTEIISREILFSNYYDIAHKLFIALATRLMCFSRVKVLDFKNILNEYLSVCNNLDIKEVINSCRKLYYLTIEKYK
ncbi:hypothetical protein NGRA_1236 [Nosema granulosis]|uniref:Uncharacterized protein n=1 Tax=Nosema granulosis TaxID=83296 RepID=A0A9P6KZE2_9MICR|nr:hypothetical protein NGRA_1236 [Nosema granulosis]